MSIRSRLEAVVEHLPRDASVSLPVGWLRDLLEEEPAGELPELLDLEDVAEIVGRSVSTVRTWCNSGEMEGAFKLRGREWKIPREALRRFLAREAAEDGARSVPPGGDDDLSSWRDVVGEE